MLPSFLGELKPHFDVKTLAIVPLLVAALISAGCGGVSAAAAGTPAQSAHVRVTISPSNLVLASGSQQQLAATVRNTSNTTVRWTTSLGTITSSGLFIAPVVASSSRAVVEAISVEDKTSKAISILTIEPYQPLQITHNGIFGGIVGVPYTLALTANGGSSPYQWSMRGSLPQGLSFHIANGTISGTPNKVGSFPIKVVVTDASSNAATQSLNLSVGASDSVSGNNDGPAELPRVYIRSTLADTPAPGSTVSVASGGDLQAALDNASCGDTIQLNAGATYTGLFTLPAKNCDDQHWIILRTSAPDSALPSEGTRMTPCYAGVSSLPARPLLQCKSTANVLAKLVMSTGAPGPIQFASGANHYRLLGLEITRLEGGPIVNSLASVRSEGTMDHIVFDRVWMHGTARDETTRGVELGGSTYVSIVDSFFTDFHCVSISGACTDAQAISGGIGNTPMGPYQIVDNFLEAAAENIFFGGAATVSPADIEIRRNHMFKPLTWMKGQPGYVGGTDGNPFIVKNLFELKNAQRVLFEGNVMENSWGGFSQTGFAILLTPKNQASGRTANVCPDCQVTDITIRNVMIRHVGSGMQIANGLSDHGGKARAGERYSIHDVIIDDIDGVKYRGPGEFAQISMGVGTAVLQNVTINHVTAFPPHTLFIVGDHTGTNPQMKNFVFSNNIVNAGTYPVWSTGGGSANCAVHNSPLTTLNACFNPYSFVANVIIGTTSGLASTKWPVGNSFPMAPEALNFVNYNGGNGGDYHLQNSSPYKAIGTDGRDPGADVDAVESAIAGVE